LQNSQFFFIFFWFQTIFLPGDNDIGGENEDVSVSKLKRFYSHFGTAQAVPFSEYLFVKVNFLLAISFFDIILLYVYARG